MINLNQKIERAKAIKNQIESIKNLKSEYRQINQDIINELRFKINTLVLTKIKENKDNQDYIDLLLELGANFTDKQFKDYEKCLEEYESLSLEIKEMNIPNHHDTVIQDNGGFLHGGF